MKTYCSILLVLFLTVPVWSRPLGDKEKEVAKEEVICKRVLTGVEFRGLAGGSGAGAVEALTSVLNYLGADRNEGYIAGISGCAFKFVYDRARILEPLRDLYPVDYYSRACEAVGAESGWVNPKNPDEFRETVKKSVDEGLPLITSYLNPREYKGFSIITGYDYCHHSVIGTPAGPGFILVQAAEGKEDPEGKVRYSKVELSRNWSGPVMSSERWIDYPLFALKGKPVAADERKAVLRALEYAVLQAEGEAVEYAYHPRAQAMAMDKLSGGKAEQGLSAFGLLRTDLKSFDEDADFYHIWRIHTKMSELALDRARASSFLEQVKHVLKGDEKRIEELSALYAETSDLAGELAELFWSKEFYGQRDPKEVKRGVKKGEKVVYLLSLSRDSMKKLRRWNVVMMPEGQALIRARSDRIKEALDIADRIISNEKKCTGLVREVLSGGN